MTITANSGPYVAFGTVISASGSDLEHNADRGVSAVDLGMMRLDPRAPFGYQPGAASSKPFYGWAGPFSGPVVDQAPSAKSTNIIAATQVPVGGTALTLNTVSSNGFGAATTITAFEGGSTSVRAIDGAMTGAAFGVSGGVNIWNPATAVARTLSFFGSSNGSSAEAWSIAGRDIYGQKMTELVLGASTGQSSNVGAVSLKAWKYISAITPSTVNGSIGSTLVIVGTNDVFGFPIRVDHPAYAQAYLGASSNAVVLASSQFLFASTAATATSTTGDVRGTVASTISSTAAGFRVVIVASPSVANLLTVTSTNTAGLVGVTQFSSI
jgi:hypothetical protein